MYVTELSVSVSSVHHWCPFSYDSMHFIFGQIENNTIQNNNSYCLIIQSPSFVPKVDYNNDFIINCHYMFVVLYKLTDLIFSIAK